MSDKQLHQGRTGIVAVVLAVSGIVLLLLPVNALRWARLPFPGFLLDPNLVVNDTDEARWAGEQVTPPLAYPERVTTLDGTAVAANDSWRALLREKQPGETISLTLVQPQDSRVPPRQPVPERAVTLPLTTLSASTLWNQFWLFYLTGLFAWVIGVWTFRARPGNEAAQAFALFTATGALSVAGLFDLVTTQAFVRVWIVALSFVGCFALWTASVFPHETRLMRRWPWFKLVLLAVSTAIAAWGLLWLVESSDPWAYAIPWRAAYLFNAAGLVAGLLLMAYRGWRSPSALVRQQGRIILLGGILAFAPLLVFFLTASLGIHIDWWPPTLYIPPVAIYPLAIGYTIVRFKLLNIGNLTFRRGVTYVIVTGLLMFVFVLLVTGLTATFGSIAENPWLVAVMMVLVALLFDPLRNWMQVGIDQMFFRQPVTFDQLLREYQRELTTAVNMNQVADVLLSYLKRGAPNAEARLYLPDQKANCYSSYANHSDVIVETESPLIAFMQQQDHLIELGEERAWPPALQQTQETVQALQATVLAPLQTNGDLLGWLTLHPRPGSGEFSSAELGYFQSLAEQSVLGLARATVVRSLESRVAELDLLTQFSQYLSYIIDYEALVELVFVNYERLLGVEDFFIALRHQETGRIYPAFYLEAGERKEKEREGVQRAVTIPEVLHIIESGQMASWQDENGRSWYGAPLNAGADTLGAVYTFFRDPAHVLRPRQQQLFTAFADRTAVTLERLNTNKELEERARQLEIINQVTFTLASTLELQPLLELILDKAIELLNAEAGTFMLRIPDTGELEFRVVRGPEELLGTRLPAGTGLAGTAAQTGQPVLVNRVHDDKRWHAQVSTDTNFDTNSILTVPMLRQNQVLGVLQVLNKQNGVPFDEEDQRLLLAFSGQAVVALENARLLAQTDLALQKSVDELSLLQQLDRDLNTTLNLDTVLNITLERMLGICKGTAGAIVLVDEEKRPYSLTSRGYDDSFVRAANGDTEILRGGLVGHVIRSGKPHVTGNVHDEASEESGYIAASFSTHSQLTMPLRSKQELIGVIAVESDQLEAFDPYLRETAVRVTNHASVAIANAILYEQVNEANRAKSEFVSMVSHELKTPMTAIRGYVDLLLSGMTGELSVQQHNFLDTIAANIRRMGQQIQDLTDISRIEMNQLHTEMGPTDLTAVLMETMQTVQALCDEKQITVRIEQPQKLPLVLGDKGRLVQVLTNLLSNACKYSPAETEVIVRFNETVENERAFVHCLVQDQGYGISIEDQQQLFTKFFRSQDPNIRQSKGTGLGLSITRGIVELHGGRIWVESRAGAGSTFHFTIPQAAV